MEEKSKGNTMSNTQEISLKELILKMKGWYRLLLSKWPIILIYGILGGILGLTYAWFKKPVYTAATTFVLEEGDKGGGLGQYAGLASMVGIDLGSDGGGIFQGDNILELYKSRNMIEKTLLTEITYQGKKQLLIDHYINFNNLRENWAKIPELRNIKFNPSQEISSRLQDSIIGTVVNEINKNYLKVEKPDKKLSIIKAETKAPDEYFAKAFNEQIVKNVNDFYVQTKTKKSLRNVEILQHKADSVRSVMNGAIYTAAVVTDATPNLNPTRQVQRTAPVQRSQFSAETNKVILAELVKNLELSKLTLSKETPLIQVVDEPKFPLEKYKLGKIKSIFIGGIIGMIVISLIYIFRLILREL